MDENAKVKAENIKLRCVLEKHEAKFMRLEQRDKEKTNLIAKMDDDIKEIKQSSANATHLILMYANLFTQKLSHWSIKRRMISWIETSLRNHDVNESNTITVNIVHDQEKISLEDSVQKMPERLNEDVSQRESNSGSVTEHSNSLLVTEELAYLFYQASHEEDKNLKDKTVRSQIYNKIKPYLLDISDEYLRKIISKAKKINKLFGYNYNPITLKKIKAEVPTFSQPNASLEISSD
ncbi:1366_t:CDS:2, partial [Rhizophagus irregularis]